MISSQARYDHFDTLPDFVPCLKQNTRL